MTVLRGHPSEGQDPQPDPGLLARPLGVEEHARPDHRQRESLDLQLEADRRDQPAGHGRADVRAEDHADGLGKGHEP